jgi:hypothetical protein
MEADGPHDRMGREGTEISCRSFLLPGSDGLATGIGLRGLSALLMTEGQRNVDQQYLNELRAVSDAGHNNKPANFRVTRLT